MECELPDPVNVDAATTTVRAEDVIGKFACGPDPDGFLDSHRDELAGRIRQERAQPAGAAAGGA